MNTRPAEYSLDIQAIERRARAERANWIATFFGTRKSSK